MTGVQTCALPIYLLKIITVIAEIHLINKYILEFGNVLYKRNDELWCSVCEKQLSIKKSTIKNHLDSKDHTKNAKRKNDAIGHTPNKRLKNENFVQYFCDLAFTLMVCDISIEKLQIVKSVILDNFFL